MRYFTRLMVLALFSVQIDGGAQNVSWVQHATQLRSFDQWKVVEHAISNDLNRSLTSVSPSIVITTGDMMSETRLFSRTAADARFSPAKLSTHGSSAGAADRSIVGLGDGRNRLRHGHFGSRNGDYQPPRRSRSIRNEEAKAPRMRGGIAAAPAFVKSARR